MKLPGLASINTLYAKMHATTVLLYALQYVSPLLLGVSTIPWPTNSVNGVAFAFGVFWGEGKAVPQVFL